MLLTMARGHLLWSTVSPKVSLKHVSGRSHSTHILRIPVLNDVNGVRTRGHFTRRRGYFAVIKTENHCVVRNTIRSHLLLMFSLQRNNYAVRSDKDVSVDMALRHWQPLV